MSNIDTGGPAFPAAVVYHDQVIYAGGMDLRDYIAVRVLRMYSDDTDEMLLENAVRAYKQADAMLKARQA